MTASRRTQTTSAWHPYAAANASSTPYSTRLRVAFENGSSCGLYWMGRRCACTSPSEGKNGRGGVPRVVWKAPDLAVAPALHPFSIRVDNPLGPNKATQSSPVRLEPGPPRWHRPLSHNCSLFVQRTAMRSSLVLHRSISVPPLCTTVR